MQIGELLMLNAAPDKSPLYTNAFGPPAAAVVWKFETIGGPLTVVAVRLGGAGRVSGVVPLDARFVLPLLDGDVGVLGGRDSFRGLQYQRLAGDGVLWGKP